MGSSSYNDSYTSSKPSRKSRSHVKTPMEELISKMQEVENNRKALVEAREGLEDAENQFVEAEAELRKSEAEVKAQISKLDPESQVMLQNMLNKLSGKDQRRSGYDREDGR